MTNLNTSTERSLLFVLNVADQLNFKGSECLNSGVIQTSQIIVKILFVDFSVYLNSLVRCSKYPKWLKHPDCIHDDVCIAYSFNTGVDTAKYDDCITTKS